VFHYFPIKLHFYFFASFWFKFFASLHLSNFRFEAKQSEAKFKSIFSLFFRNFSLFSLFLAFFRFFSLFLLKIFLKIFASLRFGNLCSEEKQSEANFKSSFSLFSLFLLFSLFFAFFRFFPLFSLRFFHLIFAYFTSVFTSDFWCFSSK
jgi:hypothetical protein